jgi:hypothetical protein
MMHPPYRRVFMLKVVASSAALATAGSLQAAPKKAEESEPKAVSLGYKHDSATVDTKKFPKHAAGQKCNGCMAWLGKPSEAWAEWLVQLVRQDQRLITASERPSWPDSAPPWRRR